MHFGYFCYGVLFLQDLIFPQFIDFYELRNTPYTADF